VFGTKVCFNHRVFKGGVLPISLAFCVGFFWYIVELFAIVSCDGARRARGSAVVWPAQVKILRKHVTVGMLQRRGVVDSIRIPSASTFAVLRYA